MDANGLPPYSYMGEGLLGALGSCAIVETTVATILLECLMKSLVASLCCSYLGSVDWRDGVKLFELYATGGKRAKPLQSVHSIMIAVLTVTSGLDPFRLEDDGMVMLVMVVN